MYLIRLNSYVHILKLKLFFEIKIIIVKIKTHTINIGSDLFNFQNSIENGQYFECWN